MISALSFRPPWFQNRETRETGETQQPRGFAASRFVFPGISRNRETGKTGQSRTSPETLLRNGEMANSGYLRGRLPPAGPIGGGFFGYCVTDRGRLWP